MTDPSTPSGADRWLVAGVVVASLAAWEVAVWRDQISSLLFPAPSAILRELLVEIGDGSLGRNTGATLARLGVGFGLGSIVGLIVGLLMGWSARARHILDPFIAALHPLPKIALLPLAMVILGIGESSKIAMIAIAAFFPMVINTMHGVRTIEPAFFDVARNYGTPVRKLFARVILPGAMPSIITGVRLALSTALIITITVELLTAKTGLGGVIWLAWQTLRMERLFVALFVIGLLGLAFNKILQLLERRLVPWISDQPDSGGTFGTGA